MLSCVCVVLRERVCNHQLVGRGALCCQTDGQKYISKCDHAKRVTHQTGETPAVCNNEPSESQTTKPEEKKKHNEQEEEEEEEEEPGGQLMVSSPPKRTHSLPILLHLTSLWQDS